MMRADLLYVNLRGRSKRWLGRFDPPDIPYFHEEH